MRRTMCFLLAAGLCSLFAGAARADESQALIDLDKKWGTAAMAADGEAVAPLLADDLVSMTDEGVGDKASELAGLEAAPEGASYEATDYVVRFLDPETAIMTHSTVGEQAHHSLHVWSKKSGQWQVVATATAQAAHEEPTKAQE